MDITANKATRILEFLRSRQPQMTELLIAMVKAESPSHDKSSQVPAQEIICGALSERGYAVRKIPGKTSGGQLLAAPKNRLSGQPIQLLLGHSDTVWPLGMMDEMPVQQSDGKLRGPGVYDMKAGLVQAIFALEAVKAVDETPTVTPVMFINTDEEIGSAESKSNINRLARISDRAFVMEPSLGQSGKLKTARKGVGRFIVKVIGRASHAGLAPEKGRSAIHELSHVIQALFALNDLEKGIAVNVGLVDGGQRPNVIAPEASATVDVRVLTQEDARYIEQAILSLQPTIEGTQLEFSGGIGRPPMEKTPGNQQLWKFAQQSAEAMNLPIEEGTAGGGSDGNFTSLLCPTLDGMGAVGDGAHALNEFVFVDKMPERAALLASMLLLPAMKNAD